MDTTSPLRTPSQCQNLFVYGSLVDPRCLDQVLGRRHTGERLCARLHGYQRHMMPDYPFPYLLAASDHSVDGVLLMDLSAPDLDLLDRYEEVDAGMYRREAVEVEPWGCGRCISRVQACTYVAGPALIEAADGYKVGLPHVRERNLYSAGPEERREACKTKSSI
jgi:gamma-glutamylcyclotransferase (GGCT)/AIG2-like uncharacterized protein YtfP